MSFEVRPVLNMEHFDFRVMAFGCKADDVEFISAGRSETISSTFPLSTMLTALVMVGPSSFFSPVRMQLDVSCSPLFTRLIAGGELRGVQLHPTAIAPANSVAKNFLKLDFWQDRPSH